MVSKYLKKPIRFYKFRLGFEGRLIVALYSYKKVLPKFFAVSQIDIKEIVMIIVFERGQIILFGEGKHIRTVPCALMLIGKYDEFVVGRIEWDDLTQFFIACIDLLMQFAERLVYALFFGPGRKAVGQVDHRRRQ